MEKYITINQNGLSIRSKLYCSDMKSIDSVIVFGHGFSGHKDNRAAEKMANRMLKRHKNTALLIFDWPCHGEDASNKLRLSGCTAYLQTVTDYAKKRFRTDKLYACATSFGGYLFLKYIAENPSPFERIALRCPAVNMYDVLTKKIMTEDDLEHIRKGKPVPVGFDRKVRITREFLTELKENDITLNDYRSFSGDIMIVHGTKDEIVSFDVSKEFAEKNGIDFHPSEGADHRFTDPQKMDKALAEMLSFLF